MSTQDNLNPAQFRFVLEPDEMENYWTPNNGSGDRPKEHRMTAFQGNTVMGRIHWGVNTGDITSTTNPDYRQQGVARMMYDRAREYSAEHNMTMPSADTSIPISYEGAQMLKSLRARPGNEVYGQQPLIPREGRNRTMPGPETKEKPGHVGIY